MSQEIWVLDLPWNTRVAIEVPARAEILEVRAHGTQLRLWAKVDPQAPVRQRTLAMYAPGQQLPAGRLKRIGSFGMRVATRTGLAGHDLIVFQVFEVFELSDCARLVRAMLRWFDSLEDWLRAPAQAVLTDASDAEDESRDDERTAQG